MAGKVFVIIATILLVQFASGRVIREADKVSTDLSVTEFTEKVTDALLTLRNYVFEMTGAKNEDEFKTIVTTQAKSYAEKLDGIAKDVQVKTKDTLKDLEDNKLVKDFQGKINDAVENFKKEQPEVAETAKQLQDRFENTVKSIVGEAKKLQESPQAENIKTQIKDLTTKVLNNTIEVLKDVDTKIKSEK